MKKNEIIQEIIDVGTLSLSHSALNAMRKKDLEQLLVDAKKLAGSNESSVEQEKRKLRSRKRNRYEKAFELDYRTGEDNGRTYIGSVDTNVFRVPHIAIISSPAEGEYESSVILNLYGEHDGRITGRKNGFLPLSLENVDELISLLKTAKERLE